MPIVVVSVHGIVGVFNGTHSMLVFPFWKSLTQDKISRTSQNKPNKQKILCNAELQ